MPAGRTRRRTSAGAGILAALLLASPLTVRAEHEQLALPATEPDLMTGKDINGLQLWVKSFIVSADLARFVSVRVQDKFVGAAAGDIDKLETYMEDVVKSVSEAQYSGARIVKQYWWQIRKALATAVVSEVTFTPR